MPNKKKRTAHKKSARKTTKRKAKTIKAASKSPARKKKFSPKRKRVTDTGVVAETALLLDMDRRQAREGEGDSQGLSNRAIADSESVEELVEEGNALEADAVKGVEDALDPDQGEVRTHEVLEDDVPQEYLDK